MVTPATNSNSISAYWKAIALLVTVLVATVSILFASVFSSDNLNELDMKVTSEIGKLDTRVAVSEERIDQQSEDLKEIKELLHETLRLLKE